jgi:succinate-acetate transporter protein
MIKPYSAWRLPLLFSVVSIQVVLLAVRRWATNPTAVAVGGMVALSGLLLWYLALRRAGERTIERSGNLLLVIMVLVGLFGSRLLTAVL